jgi:hypothetical protein
MVTDSLGKVKKKMVTDSYKGITLIEMQDLAVIVFIPKVATLPFQRKTAMLFHHTLLE